MTTTLEGNPTLDPKGIEAAIEALVNEDEPSYSARREVAVNAITAYLAALPPSTQEAGAVRVKAVHAASTEEAKAGWKLSLGYLDSVRNFIVHETGYDATIEYTQACLLIGAHELAIDLSQTPETSTDDVRKRVAEVLKEVADSHDNGVWRPCSGCYETSDAYNVNGYPYSASFGCILGSGCTECGGIGAVWDTIDYDAMARETPDTSTISAEQVKPVAWPSRRANVPYHGSETTRLVGFVVERGDEAFGEYGLSEPLSWLDRMCAAPIQGDSPASTVEGMTAKAICELMDDFRRRAPFGYHELGSPRMSYKSPLILHSNDIERLLDRLLDAAIAADKGERATAALAASPALPTGSEGEVETLAVEIRNAVLSCSHTITAEKIELLRSDAHPGINALGQLSGRIRAALLSASNGKGAR